MASSSRLSTTEPPPPSTRPTSPDLCESGVTTSSSPRPISRRWACRQQSQRGRGAGRYSSSRLSTTACQLPRGRLSTGLLSDRSRSSQASPCAPWRGGGEVRRRRKSHRWTDCRGRRQRERTETAKDEINVPIALGAFRERTNERIFYLRGYNGISTV